MITRLAVKNFRALRDTQVSLGSFHVLVGPNGSGKSTLLDVLGFLRDCINSDLRVAVRRRAGSLDELTFGGKGGEIEFHVEFDFGVGRTPEVHYSLTIGAEPSSGIQVVREELRLVRRLPGQQVLRPKDLLISKVPTENRDEYLVESGPFSIPGDGANRDVFSFGTDHLALGRLPQDPSKYPTAFAVRSFLAMQVNLLNFIPSTMGTPCSTLEPDEFAVDGHNLARVAARILNPRTGNEDFDPTAAKAEWLDHLRLALPDLKDITWAQRPDDRAEYLKLTDRQGLVLPSWSLSEGTLRMLGLTLLPFLPRRSGIHLIEEPENAVHPHALEVIIGALRGIPRAQVMLTTHSPLVVDLVGKDPLLIFSKKEGAVSIQTAEQHSALKDWDGSQMLSSLFSAGYLQ